MFICDHLWFHLFMDLIELMARESIHDTTAPDAQCAGGGRFEEKVQLFRPDEVMYVERREPLRGRDAILAFLTSTKQSLQESTTRPFIRHHVNSVRIEVGAEAAGAQAASYF